MNMTYETRTSDSLYIESITHGWTMGNGTSIRPAEYHWHMVFVRENGNTHSILVGPLTASGIVTWGGSAEILWIKFKLGAYLSHYPTKNFRDTEATLPEALRRSFWLEGSTRQVPTYENVEVFVGRLAREGVLSCDPLVNAALENQRLEMAPRTMRHRFLYTTGLTHSYIKQAKRAQRAATLLEQGIPIIDTVYELGYFDQPHMTRALKQFIGYTPGQIVQMRSPA